MSFRTKQTCDLGTAIKVKSSKARGNKAENKSRKLELNKKGKYKVENLELEKRQDKFESYFFLSLDATHPSVVSSDCT